LIMSANLMSATSGKVCLRGKGLGVGLEPFDCLSYGTFTGNTEGFGNPAAALSITANQSLTRTGAGFGNSAFTLVTNTPRNNANQTGAVPAPPGDVALTKTDSPDPVGVGSNLTYTITVTAGSTAATGVVVTDTLPGGVNFVSAVPSQGSCSGTATVTCNLGTVNGGAGATVTIVVTPTAAATLNNTASVTANEADPNSANNSATATTTVQVITAEAEPNQPIASAQRLFVSASGSVTVAATLASGDLDFFTFQGTQGNQVTIDIDGAAKTTTGHFDSFIALFGVGPTFTLLTSSDDSTVDTGSLNTLDSRITSFTLASTGLFTVGVGQCCGFATGGTGGVAGTSTSGTYTLIISGVTPLPAPTVTSVVPNSGSTAGGTNITITGTGFVSGATVTFGGTAATNVTVVNATSITATTPAKAAGAATVVATNPDNQSSTQSISFTFVAAPTVTSVVPSNGSTAGGTSVTITGTGFVGATSVTFGGTNATSFTVVDGTGTSMTATTPAKAAGAVDVVVINSNNQSGTLSNGFTFVAGGGVTVSGTVTLQGRTASFPTGVGHNIATVTISPGSVTASVAADGTFQFSGVSAGTVTFTASAAGYLSAQRADVQVGSSAVSLPAVQLRAGLVNSDTAVTILDISATVASFGASPAARIDAQGRFVDQNGDGAVSILDISAVVSSFGQSSPTAWP